MYFVHVVLRVIPRDDLTYGPTRPLGHLDLGNGGLHIGFDGSNPGGTAVPAIGRPAGRSQGQRWTRLHRVSKGIFYPPQWSFSLGLSLPRLTPADTPRPGGLARCARARGSSDPVPSVLAVGVGERVARPVEGAGRVSLLGVPVALGRSTQNQPRNTLGDRHMMVIGHELKCRQTLEVMGPATRSFKTRSWATFGRGAPPTTGTSR